MRSKTRSLASLSLLVLSILARISSSYFACSVVRMGAEFAGVALAGAPAFWLAASPPDLPLSAVEVAAAEVAAVEEELLSLAAGGPVA